MNAQIHKNMNDAITLPNEFYDFNKSKTVNDFDMLSGGVIKIVKPVTETSVRNLTYTSNIKKIKSRISDLKNMAREYDDIDFNNICKSEKCLITFLNQINPIVYPSITMNDSGMFNMHWEENRNKKILMVFRDYEIDFVIFSPDDKIGRTDISATVSVNCFFYFIREKHYSVFFEKKHEDR